ncbi:MAG: hypothetical protein R3D05_19845 [Dongiaceae bacterium]
MLHQTYSYADTLAAQERITWRVEDLIGPDKPFDFGKPFLPESLARVRQLDFLLPEEQRLLNQIRAHGYLYMFGLVEEFILPFVMDHTRARLGLDNDDHRVRAFLEFAAEEAKHIHLFNRFREEFRRGFGTDCEVIGPADEIGKAVLAHHPVAVALVILQIEWMTQRHYIDSVKDDQTLDDRFKELLRNHWMEEAQHAKLDTLMVQSLTEGYGDTEVNAAIDDYMKIGALIDGGLQQQVQFDMAVLERSIGRKFDPSEVEQFTKQQLQAQRWTYLGSGMTHGNFIATLKSLGGNAAQRIAEITPVFC